jgi:hypothetical protein
VHPAAQEAQQPRASPALQPAVKRTARQAQQQPSASTALWAALQSVQQAGDGLPAPTAAAAAAEVLPHSSSAAPFTVPKLACNQGTCQVSCAVLSTGCHPVGDTEAQ